MDFRSFLLTFLPAFLLLGCVPAIQKAAPMHERVITNDLAKSLDLFNHNDSLLVREWWKTFGDKQLDTLIEEALSSAPSLQSLEARYAQANTVIESVQSRNLPHLSADASVIRERFSENHIFPAPLGGSTNNQYQPQLSLDYDFDFWNARSSRILAAQNTALAQRAAIEATKIALSSAMCETYLSWNYDEQKLIVLNSIDQTTKEEIKILEKQHKLGLIDGIAINDKKSALSRIKQDREKLKRSIEGKKEALCVLGGFLPSRTETLQVPHIHDGFNLPIPKEIMLNFVAHRPDVAIAKYTALSKSHTIEETKAQFYPNISLSGLIGFTSFSWAKLFDHSSYTPSTGIALSLPLLDWGLRKANLQNSVSDYNASVYDYNGVVIKAANEVVLLLKQSRHLELQRQFHEEEMAAKKTNSEIAYKKRLLGLSDKLPYLGAQKIVEEAQIETLSLNEAKTELQINLIKALGGGYTNNGDTDASR